MRRRSRAGLNHPFVGTEHLLLAFFTQPEALATKVLVARGITEQALAEAIDPTEPPRGTTASKDTEAALAAENPPYTRRAAHVLQGAVAEALVLGHNYVGTEHLLLAFYRDSASVATKVLTERGLDESAAWAAIRAALEEITAAK